MAQSSGDHAKMTRDSCTIERSQQPTRNGARRRRNKPSLAVSYTAASMLLAGAHAFSAVGRLTDGRTNSFPGSAKFFAPRDPCTRLYANPLFTIGDSDHDGGSSHGPASRQSRPSTRRFAASTRLNYRDGDEEESAARREENDLATQSLREDNEATRWWQSVFTPPAPAPTVADEEQQDVDQYLEFLDKRYKRMHEDERKPEPVPKKKKKFSALNWLTAGDKNCPITEQMEEDALYVLGVAELASERLLQKHHTALQQHRRRAPAAEVEKEPEVIDAVIEDVSQDAVSKEVSSETKQALLLATLVQAGNSVLKNIGARRQGLIDFQNKKFIAAMSLALKSAARTPAKVFKAFWNLGGGKKTIALTMSAFVTAFLLVRPVAEAMARDSLSA